jgi:hypothetical protein
MTTHIFARAGSTPAAKAAPSFLHCLLRWVSGGAAAYSESGAGGLARIGDLSWWQAASQGLAQTASSPRHFLAKKSARPTLFFDWQ